MNPNDIGPKRLYKYIEEAQAWALKHFNADQTKRTELIDPETLALLPPAFFVKFRDTIFMDVEASIMGIPSNIVITYKLVFKKDGQMGWKCITRLPRLFGKVLDTGIYLEN